MVKFILLKDKKNVFLQNRKILFDTMKIFRYVTFSALLCLSSVLCGCGGDRVPDDVMNPEKMAFFLEEAYMLEGFYAVETGFRYDTLHPQIVASYDSLLSKYAVSRDDFEHSVEWYSHHPVLYQSIHDSVIARLDRR